MTSPRIDARLNAHSPIALSVFRIIVGLMFTIHGSAKVFGWPIGVALPTGSWPGWWSGLIELVAGVLLTIGFLTRPAAFVAAGEMAVAYFWMHWPFPEGGSFWPHDPQMGGNGGELAVLYCFAFLLILFIGPGAWAVDSRRAPVTGRTVTGTAAPRRPGPLSRFRRGGVAGR